jgi:hypothetical protein
VTESVQDFVVREARAISGPRTHLQDSEAVIQFGLKVAEYVAEGPDPETITRLIPYLHHLSRCGTKAHRPRLGFGACTCGLSSLLTGLAASQENGK